MSEKPRLTTTWWVVVTVGAVLVVGQLILPIGSPVWDYSYILGALGATVVMAVSTWRMATPLRRVWWCLTGYAGLWLAADILYLALQKTSGEVPFPGWPDLLYLSSYVVAAAGLVLLARRLHPGRDAEAWIDTGILTIAATSIVTVVILVPLVADLPTVDLTAVLTVAYPLADVVILAALLRIILIGGRLGAPSAMVVGAFAAVLAADILYNVEVVYGGSDLVEATYQALYLLGFVLLAGAASLPNADTMGGRPRTVEGTTSFRTRVIAVGVLTTPVVTLLVVWPDNRPVERLLAALTLSAIVLALVRIRRLLRVVDEQATQLGRQARTDPLTGLPNRRTLDYEVERLVREARAKGTPLTVAMLDLDHFKAYNDSLGHQAGDDLLRASARSWGEALPGRAFLARYGGEEFALLLPATNARIAAPLLDAVRLATPSGCTVSIGHAELTSRESGYDALHRADVALFAAKAAGRNRVMSAEEAGATP